MLYIRIELWPGGSETKKQVLGEAKIALVSGNEGLTQGDYLANLWERKKSKRLTVWKDILLFGFPRKKLGPWDLLYRILMITIGQRNGGKNVKTESDGQTISIGKRDGARRRLDDAARA